jgi:hypothetical protein
MLTIIVAVVGGAWAAVASVALDAPQLQLGESYCTAVSLTRMI